MSHTRALTRGLTRGLTRNIDRSVAAGAAARDIDAFSFDSIADISGLAAVGPVWVSEDGTRLSIAELTTGNGVEDFTLTAHDLSTLSADQSSASAGQLIRGVFYKDDGSKIFVLWRNASNPDGIYEWPLSTPYDNTTRGAQVSSPVFSAALDNPRGFHFSPDGTKMFVADLTDAAIYFFSMSTPWSVASGSLTQDGSFSVVTETPGAVDVTFSTDGLKMYVLDLNGDVEQYNLTTAFDLSTGVTHSGVTPLAVPDTAAGGPRGIHLVGDTHLYLSFTTAPEKIELFIAS